MMSSFILPSGILNCSPYIYFCLLCLWATSSLLTTLRAFFGCAVVFNYIYAELLIHTVILFFGHATVCISTCSVISFTHMMAFPEINLFCYKCTIVACVLWGIQTFFPTEAGHTIFLYIKLMYVSCWLESSTFQLVVIVAMDRVK